MAIQRHVFTQKWAYLHVNTYVNPHTHTHSHTQSWGRWPHLPLVLRFSGGHSCSLTSPCHFWFSWQDPSSAWQSVCQSAGSRGTCRQWEPGGSGLKPPQPPQQLCGRQREVRHRCGSLESTEGTADFGDGHVCYSTFSWEEEAGALDLAWS